MQPVRPWNDQTGHLPDWLVGTRTQLMADYNQVLSVIRLCHRRPTREVLQLVEELRAESVATVSQPGDTPEPVHPRVLTRIYQAARRDNAAMCLPGAQETQ